jgi:transcriptional regulator with XRE-family HTH domain
MGKKARATVTDHDRYVGDRIKEARLSAGISQQELGDRMGVSYQQVQKYERGINRINGARIGRLVTALNRPLTYFFPNITDVRPAPVLSSFLASKEGHRIAELWPSLSHTDRLAAVKMIEHLAREQ